MAAASRCVGLPFLAAAAALGGCSTTPNAANVELRRENQKLSTQLAQTQRDDAAIKAQISVIQLHPGATTQELPEAKLDLLFTVHGLEFGRATGGYSANRGEPDQMVKVYVVPADDQGQPIKAAGSFRIELFDLAEPNTHLGQWDFTTEQARTDWFGEAFLYTYEFDCVWQTPPRHAKLVLQATFIDELTGRQFTVHKDITVNPPAK